MCIEEGLGRQCVPSGTVSQGCLLVCSEFAHSLIDPNGPVCICGKRGCVEAHCSIDALIRKSQNLTGDASLTYEKIVQLYHENDPVLSQLIKDDFCKWIGIAMGNFTQIFNPSILTYI
jgi:glucokinase